MTSPRLEPVHFLLVDDLAENLVALEALLRREDLVLLKARSGPEALELLLQHDVALALIDVQMPGMNGFELAEMMRGVERTRLVPIIFLTAGSADWQRRFRGYEAGAVDFLQKPIQPDILRSKADVFYQLYRQRQEVARQRDQLRAARDENARLLDESRQQAAALREADRRKDEFLAMLAHELRNPLAPVRNAVEILELEAISQDTVSQAREIISRQVAHMVRLIDDLLDVARIARGKIQLRREFCDLAEIVRQTADDYRPTMEAGGIDLTTNISASALPIEADPIRLAQVIGNLLHNAAKFTPAAGRVQISADRDATTNEAVVAVRDTGAGLTATELSQVFEPFVQATQSIDRNPGGLGLGLALVRGLVELHGGTVAAESAGSGCGATFSLRLPISLVAPTDRQRDEPPAAATTVAAGLRVLLVEDNRDAAQMLQLLLRSLGHFVEIAHDGQEGVAKAANFRPDVVVSDLGLPGEIDGYGVAGALRQDSQHPPLLIALSGYGQENDKRRAVEAGFDLHLVKPVTLAQLEEALVGAADRSSAGSCS